MYCLGHLYITAYVFTVVPFVNFTGLLHQGHDVCESYFILLMYASMYELRLHHLVIVSSGICVGQSKRNSCKYIVYTTSLYVLVIIVICVTEQVCEKLCLVVRLVPGLTTQARVNVV